MVRQHEFMAEVWREASRHIEIHDFTAIIAQRLVGQDGVDELEVRRLDRFQPGLVTVAVAGNSLSEAGASARTDFSPRQMREFRRWCKSEELVALPEQDFSLAKMIVPGGELSRVILAPLSCGGEPEGVLLVRLQRGRKTDSRSLQLIEMLMEPFGVALENDRRLHEMATLREAAEAERGALLRRLGRSQDDETIVGSQSGLRGVMERVQLVAKSDIPVLVLGETGSGKEVIARALHNQGSHAGGPFIRVNCGAIPAELIDSQLFGHERGSFTGAEKTHPGWFERADGGTLFLDEVGELPLEAQVRLLRVLQDGFVERVGGTHPIHVDVRVVAATHRDLTAMVTSGTFREDLWYRLAVFPILLPPLRERRGDIGSLVQHFAQRAATRFGLPVAAPSPKDLELLTSYHWPGNIRELSAVIDRAAILGAGKRLDVATALGWTGPQPNDSPMKPNREVVPRHSDKMMTLDEVVRQHIEHVLKTVDGRVEGSGGAAELLDINPHTLRSRMRKLGIAWSNFRSR